MPASATRANLIRNREGTVPNDEARPDDAVLPDQKPRRRLIYDPELDIYQCPGRGKDCRFAEAADGTLERFGADCGRLPSSSRGK